VDRRCFYALLTNDHLNHAGAAVRIETIKCLRNYTKIVLDLIRGSAIVVQPLEPLPARGNEHHSRLHCG